MFLSLLHLVWISNLVIVSGFGVNLMKVSDEDPTQILCTMALLHKYFYSGETLSGSVLSVTITSASMHLQQNLLQAMHRDPTYPWSIVVRNLRKDMLPSTPNAVLNEKPQSYFLVVENLENDDIDDIFEDWKISVNWNPLAQFVVYMAAVEDTDDEMSEMMIEILLGFMNKKIFNVNVLGQSEENGFYFGKTTFPYHPDNNCGNRVISVETLDICDYHNADSDANVEDAGDGEDGDDEDTNGEGDYDGIEDGSMDGSLGSFDDKDDKKQDNNDEAKEKKNDERKNKHHSDSDGINGNESKENSEDKLDDEEKLKSNEDENEYRVENDLTDENNNDNAGKNIKVKDIESMEDNEQKNKSAIKNYGVDNGELEYQSSDENSAKYRKEINAEKLDTNFKVKNKEYTHENKIEKINKQNIENLKNGKNYQNYEKGCNKNDDINGKKEEGTQSNIYKVHNEEILGNEFENRIEINNVNITEELEVSLNLKQFRGKYKGKDSHNPDYNKETETKSGNYHPIKQEDFKVLIKDDNEINIKVNNDNHEEIKKNHDENKIKMQEYKSNNHQQQKYKFQIRNVSKNNSNVRFNGSKRKNTEGQNYEGQTNGDTTQQTKNKHNGNQLENTIKQPKENKSKLQNSRSEDRGLNKQEHEKYSYHEIKTDDFDETRKNRKIYEAELLCKEQINKDITKQNEDKANHKNKQENIQNENKIVKHTETKEKYQYEIENIILKETEHEIYNKDKDDFLSNRKENSKEKQNHKQHIHGAINRNIYNNKNRNQNTIRTRRVKDLKNRNLHKGILNPQVKRGTSMHGASNDRLHIEHALHERHNEERLNLTIDYKGNTCLGTLSCAPSARIQTDSQINADAPKIYIEELYRALFLDKIPRDLKGCPIIAAYRPWEPYIFNEDVEKDADYEEAVETLYRDENDDDAKPKLRMNGIEYALLQTIGEVLHVNINLEVKNRNLYQLFQRLVDGDIELLLGGVDEDPSISQFVASTVPYRQDDLTWCVAKAKRKQTLFNFLASFELGTWMLTLAFIFAASLNVLISQRLLRVTVIPTDGYIFIAIRMLGVVLSQSIQLPSISTTFKLLFGTSFFMGLMFSNVYQSFLISTLTNPRSSYQISHVEEIYQNRMFITGTVENVRHLNKEGETFKYFRQQFQMCYNIEECLQRAAADERLAVAVSRQHAFYNPRIPRDDLYCFDRNENLYVYLVTMLLPKKFHLMHKINPVVQHVIESGHLEKWARDLDSKRKIHDEIHKVREDPFKSLTLSEVGGTFVFSAIWLLGALVLLLVERWVHQKVVKERTRWKILKFLHRKFK